MAACVANVVLGRMSRLVHRTEINGSATAATDKAAPRGKGPGTVSAAKGEALAGAGWKRTGRAREEPAADVAASAVGCQTRPLGTVWKYVLLKTIFPRCQMALGFGGLGGWS